MQIWNIVSSTCMRKLKLKRELKTDCMFAEHLTENDDNGDIMAGSTNPANN